MTIADVLGMLWPGGGLGGTKQRNPSSRPTNGAFLCSHQGVTAAAGATTLLPFREELVPTTPRTCKQVAGGYELFLAGTP